MGICFFYSLFNWGNIMSFSYLKNILIFRSKYFFYILNFIMLTILTIIPFLVVIEGTYSKIITSFIVIFCLIFQVLVHIKSFFYLDFSYEYRWNMISIIFAFLIIIIILFGSHWIMTNLNHHVHN